MNTDFIDNVNKLSAKLAELVALGVELDSIDNLNQFLDELHNINQIKSQVTNVSVKMPFLNTLESKLPNLISISDNLDEVLKVNKNYDDFFNRYDSINGLLSKFRVELDSFFSLVPEIELVHKDIQDKKKDIDKYILTSSENALVSSNAAAIATDAKDEINSKYEVYLDVKNIKNEVELLAPISDEIKDISTAKENIVNVSLMLDEISNLFGIRNQILSLESNLSNILDAKETSTSNAKETKQDLEIITKYKNDTREYRNSTITNRDIVNEAIASLTPKINKINRQSSDNAKLAFTIHDLSTKSTIEITKSLIKIQELFENKKIDLDNFVAYTSVNMQKDINNAKEQVNKDVQTSSKIVASISDKLHLLTEAKHKEIKNELRFKNSELYSVISLSKVILENKSIKEYSQNEIENIKKINEENLKGKDHENIKNKLLNTTNSIRLDVVVAKSIITDIQLQNI